MDYQERIGSPRAEARVGQEERDCIALKQCRPHRTS